MLQIIVSTIEDMSGSTVDNSRLRGDKEAAGDIDQHAARRSMKINTNSSIDAAQIHTHSTPVVFKVRRFRVLLLGTLTYVNS